MSFFNSSSLLSWLVIATAILGLISVTLNTTADVVVTFGAAMARAGLENRPSLVMLARQAAGAIMCGLGVSLFFARRST